MASQLPVKPEWSDALEQRWKADSAGAPSDDGGGRSPAYNYPPTAYLWQTLGYLAASGGTLFDELLGARLMSALWVPVTVLATWLLAGELLGRRRILQTAAAAVPALAPMFTFISASVSPDGMMYALWTLAFWLGVRAVRRGVPLADGAAFFAVVGLACTVKATSYALLVPAAFVAVVALAARRPWRIGGVVKLAAAVVVPVALTLGVWFVVAHATDHPAAAQLSAGQVGGASAGGGGAGASAGSAGASTSGGGTSLREFASYLWQYYLPRLPVQTDFQMPFRGYPLLQVWIKQGWASFGWLEIKFPEWLYRVLGVLTMAIFAGGLAALIRARRRLDTAVVVFLVLACGALARRPALDRLPPDRGGLEGLHAGALRVPRDQRDGARAGRQRLTAPGPALGDRDRRARSPACSCSTSSASASCWSGSMRSFVVVLAVGLVGLVAVALTQTSSLVYSLGVSPSLRAAQLFDGSRACQGPVRAPTARRSTASASSSRRSADARQPDARRGARGRQRPRPGDGAAGAAATPSSCTGSRASSVVDVGRVQTDAPLELCLVSDGDGSTLVIGQAGIASPTTSATIERQAGSRATSRSPAHRRAVPGRAGCPTSPSAPRCSAPGG